MKDIINEYLLSGDKFTLEVHLRQCGFMYSVCGPFTKERIPKFKETRYSAHIYLNKLDKTCF